MVAPESLRKVGRASVIIMVPIFVTAVLFGVSELVLRLFWPQDSRMESSRSLGLPDDSLGHVLRPDNIVVERGPEYSATYAVNAAGFRGDSLSAAENSPPRRRMLLIGDSFTFGHGVDFSDTWGAKLERGLRQSGNEVEVINAGVPGYDTRTEVIYLRRIVARCRPSVVLVGFLPNDLFTNQPLDDSSEATRKAVAETEQIVARAQSEKTATLHLLTFAERLAMRVDYLYCSLYMETSRREYFQMPPSAHLQTQTAITRRLLDEMKDVCDAHGARLVVLSIPQQFQVLFLAGGYAREGIDPRWVDREFADHAQERGYTWLPVLEALVAAYQEDGEDLFYRIDGHLTPRGNAVIADFLLANAETLLGT